MLSDTPFTTAWLSIWNSSLDPCAVLQSTQHSESYRTFRQLRFMLAIIIHRYLGLDELEKRSISIYRGKVDRPMSQRRKWVDVHSNVVGMIWCKRWLQWLPIVQTTAHPDSVWCTHNIGNGKRRLFVVRNRSEIRSSRQIDGGFMELYRTETMLKQET